VSTRVIVTGGAGFIGTLLARRLLAKPVTIGDARPAPVDELVLVDLVAPPPDVAADPRVRAVTGDLAGAADELEDADAIFHLAGVVSGAAEADFDLGMRVNLDGTRAVLDRARRHRTAPVLVFSSSLAVFGADPALRTGAGGPVGDDTLPRPQSSYGIYRSFASRWQVAPLWEGISAVNWLRPVQARPLLVRFRAGRRRLFHVRALALSLEGRDIVLKFETTGSLFWQSLLLQEGDRLIKVMKGDPDYYLIKHIISVDAFYRGLPELLEYAQDLPTSRAYRTEHRFPATPYGAWK
jgi:hypothetical protein